MEHIFEYTHLLVPNLVNISKVTVIILLNQTHIYKFTYSFRPSFRPYMANDSNCNLCHIPSEISSIKLHFEAHETFFETFETIFHAYNS